MQQSFPHLGWPRDVFYTQGSDSTEGCFSGGRGERGRVSDQLDLKKGRNNSHVTLDHSPKAEEWYYCLKTCLFCPSCYEGHFLCLWYLCQENIMLCVFVYFQRLLWSGEIQALPTTLFNTFCFWFVFAFWNRLSYITTWPQIHFVAKGGQELLIFLPLPPMCWDYRRVPPYLASWPFF